MRVVQVTGFGGPEVLRPAQVPDPQPGEGQLLVDVHSAEVLFLDTQLRSGWGRDFFDVTPPFVPGAGVAGVVAATGPGVDQGWSGARVVAGTSGPGAYVGGGYAERAAVPVAGAHRVPDGVSTSDALAALTDGRTARSRFEKSGVREGSRVLVTAAAGSLGVWLVALARAAGATVIGTARGERKLAHVRELGAHRAVDYGDPGWAGEVGGVDVVFDGAGGAVGAAAFGLLAEGGRFFGYGAASGNFAPIDPQLALARGVSVFGIDDGIPAGEDRPLVQRALADVAAGRVVPVLGQAVPLEQAADAHAAIEARTVLGKSVLTVRR